MSAASSHVLLQSMWFATGDTPSPSNPWNVRTHLKMYKRSPCCSGDRNGTEMVSWGCSVLSFAVSICSKKSYFQLILTTPNREDVGETSKSFQVPSRSSLGRWFGEWTATAGHPRFLPSMCVILYEKHRGCPSKPLTIAPTAPTAPTVPTASLEPIPLSRTNCLGTTLQLSPAIHRVMSGAVFNCLWILERLQNSN
jgi:hypothetical protein